MKHRFLLIILAALTAIPQMGAWSKKGHQVVAYIAQRHLTTTAYRAINELLDGDNIVYWASWLDAARDDADYAFTSGWHYVNVNADQTYDSRPGASGDAAAGMRYCNRIFADPSSSRADRQLAVKIAVHVIGDLHQPLHCGHQTDYGGNNIRIYYKGSSTSLHSFWDYTIVEDAHPSWNYYQWSVALDVLPEYEASEIAAGDHDDWGREGVHAAAYVYDYFTPWGYFDGDDVADLTPLVERQLLRGGLRLGAYLNGIFDPDAAGEPLIDADIDAPADVYTIDGRCVMRRATIDEAMRSLPRGFYIHGHRKIAVR